MNDGLRLFNLQTTPTSRGPFWTATGNHELGTGPKTKAPESSAASAYDRFGENAAPSTDVLTFRSINARLTGHRSMLNAGRNASPLWSGPLPGTLYTGRLFST